MRLPSNARSMGTHAKPMLNSSRGENEALTRRPICGRTVDNRPEVLEPHAERLAVDPHADELACDTVGADLLERRARDELVLVVELDEPLETGDLERVVRDVHVVAVVEDAGLDAALVARRDRAQLELLAGGHDRVPELVREAGVAQVHLVAELRAPACSRDHDRDAVELGLLVPVVALVGDLVAEELADQRLRQRPLDLQRRHVGLADLDIEARERLHTERVQQRVGVGEREPEVVLGELQQDRVVDDAAVGRADQHVLALPGCVSREIARREQLREPCGVGAGDLDLALDRYVPQRDLLDEVPVLLDVVVVERGDQHVVVQVPAGAAGFHGALEVRRLLVPAREVERERRVLLGHRVGHPFRRKAPRRRSFLISRTML